ncbi:MAG TPA: Flp family type IVb pilin [Anaerolineae bacterium]|nr:Flp family type IVb pilin [Anaerolineae bacterium]HOQ98435.1 Flp family type IVb pilin [Anaerolineae bacterium]HPL27016.1 Flp family type IVb pilin [Anaerolineae bacterium]
MLAYCITWLRTTRLYRHVMPEEGQDLAEYALLIGLIAVAVVAAVVVLGENINGAFEKIGDALKDFVPETPA